MEKPDAEIVRENGCPSGTLQQMIDMGRRAKKRLQARVCGEPTYTPDTRAEIARIHTRLDEIDKLLVADSRLIEGHLDRIAKDLAANTRIVNRINIGVDELIDRE